MLDIIILSFPWFLENAQKPNATWRTLWQDPPGSLSIWTGWTGSSKILLQSHCSAAQALLDIHTNLQKVNKLLFMIRLQIHYDMWSNLSQPILVTTIILYFICIQRYQLHRLNLILLLLFPLWTGGFLLIGVGHTHEQTPTTLPGWGNCDICFSFLHASVASTDSRSFHTIPLIHTCYKLECIFCMGDLSKHKPLSLLTWTTYQRYLLYARHYYLWLLYIQYTVTVWFFCCP